MCKYFLIFLRSMQQKFCFICLITCFPCTVSQLSCFSRRAECTLKFGKSSYIDLDNPVNLKSMSVHSSSTAFCQLSEAFPLELEENYATDASIPQLPRLVLGSQELVVKHSAGIIFLLRSGKLCQDVVTIAITL